MLLIVLSMTAMAEPNPGCSTPIVESTTPSNIQTDVPLDVKPRVTLSHGDCAASEYEITLSENDLVVVSETKQYDWQVHFNEFEITPPALLEAQTTYTLNVVPLDGSGEIAIITFETGEALAVGLSGAPSIALHDAVYYDQESYVIAEATYDLSPAEDPDALSTIYVYLPGDTDNPLASFQAGQMPAGALVSTYTDESAPPDEICLQVAQRDGAGQLSELSEPTCLVAEWYEAPGPGSRDCGGCSTVTPLTLTWFSPLLALVALRRRSRSTAGMEQPVALHGLVNRGFQEHLRSS